MFYFDNAATTPLTDTVIEVMSQTMSSIFGNPSSTHAYGRNANKLLRDCRNQVAQIFATDPRKIIFTSGGTESNNTAIKGYALANQDKGKHIISTAIEHHSVLHTLDYLKERFGFEITYLKPIKGQIFSQQIQEALRDDTILVSTMFVNNETGDILPIQEIGSILREHQAVFHVDAVQAVGKFPVHPEKLNIDFLSASAHKFHGPKGTGILYANSLHFDSLLHGGEQEEKHRASTENLVGIKGLTQALLSCHKNQENYLQHVKKLKSIFLRELSEIDHYLNSEETALPHVVNIGFPNYNNDALLAQLDLSGFAVSTGSACTAGTVSPSHVLMAKYGSNSQRLKESIRISFSEQNTYDEVEALCKKIKEIVGK
ncbi:cysteine desulfurase family protein [Streptococcus macacae]|uniref:cysteine desulfurase n=1 Tax=Streptococcus macacae NCTC 11558 TaxID=764298 RepID=G5JUA6_9STRE|nr:cysteine desulfurase family protein [Streptococcus macacae]EHJ52743.1 aminotransferase, class V [Streptococcus macacae NCTC 11558]SUN78469.1 iron-sulfur cofactor synthesis protein [Streptococcus macacae NCTC 11558]